MAGLVLKDGARIYVGVAFPRNPVGGGDTIYVSEGDGSVFSGCTIPPSPNSAVTYSMHPRDGKNGPLTFHECSVPGTFDPRSGQPDPTPCKRAASLNLANPFAWIRGEVFGIDANRGEQCFYNRNAQGDCLWSGVRMKWAGRSALQDTNRRWEGDSERPMGRGRRMVVGCEIEDVCLERGGGGSALSFKGGAPESDVLVRGTRVLLGCTPGLVEPWASNITGALVMEEHSGFGLQYGYRSLLLDEFEARVGEVYPGVDQARRTNVKIDAVKYLIVKDSIIIQGVNASKRALEIGMNVLAVRFQGEIEIRGEIVYKGEPYENLAKFRAAHGELFE